MSLNSRDFSSSMFQCKLCDKKFDQPQTLALHEKHHQYKFQCGYCSRKMKTEREFLRHEATHAESNTNTYGNKPKDTKKPKSTKVVQDPERSDQTESSQQSKTSRPSKEIRPPSQQSRPSTQQSSLLSGQKRPPTQEKINETDDLFKQAVLYDDIHTKCLELEKEIEALQSRYKLSDSDEDDNQIKSMKTESFGGRESKHGTESNDDAYEISDSELNANTNDDDNIVWYDDNKTVPKNWKVAKSKNGSHSKNIFKSPEGFVFQTRVKALEFMINGNYPENLLSLMKNNLGEEGWINDRSCPIQWKTRKTLGYGRDKDKEWEYLSPVMEVIPSMQDMFNFMQSHGGFDLKQIKKMEVKIVGFKHKSSCRKDNEDENKIKTDAVAKDVINELKKRGNAEFEDGEEVLPAGWSKKRIGESNVYVSPEGDIVHTIQQVLLAVELSLKPVAVKEESPVGFKPSVAEKRKFEELFAMNKKGRLDSQKMKQKSEGFSAEQIKILEDSYSKSLYPDSGNIEEICNATNLTDREVKKWFVKRADEQARSQLKSRSKNSAKLDSPKEEKSITSGSVDPYFPSKISNEFHNLSDLHIASLDDIFKGKPYPTADNFKQISDRLSIDRHIIIKWFRFKRMEKQAEATNEAKNIKVETKSEAKSPVMILKDKNNIITEEQERSLQAILVKTKNPTHRDYKVLVVATGLSRLKIEKWFNFQR